MIVIKSDTIYIVEDDRAKEFSSPFALEKFEKERRHWENNAWKVQDDGGGALFSRSMLWSAKHRHRTPQRARMTCVQQLGNRRFYVLEMSRTAGLFYYDVERDEEIRLFHREAFSPRGLHVAGDHGIFTTVSDGDGSSHIVRLDADGRQAKQLTSGDCQDENPYFRDGSIYYQTAGIARNPQGIPVLHAPAAINRLDLNTGTIETLKSSETFDFLLPKADGQGALYYIKAPYVMNQVRHARLAFEVLMLPVRILMALFSFLNAFSMFFQKKPLITSGGPDLGGVDMTKRMLHNRMVDIRETTRKEGKKVAAPGNWKLICSRNGVEEELASNVVWYDLDAEGRIIYTDGFSVYGNDRKLLYKSDELMTYVAL